LDEVFRVRRIEERYERGEVGKQHHLSMRFILTAVDEPQMPTRSYMLSTESRTRKRRMATPTWIRTRSMSKKTIMRGRHFLFSTPRRTQPARCRTQSSTRAWRHQVVQ
jgi:hypothetical protein